MPVHEECGRLEAHVGPGRPGSRGSAGEQGAWASTPRGLGWRLRRGQAGTCRGQAQVLQNSSHCCRLLHVRQEPPPASTPSRKRRVGKPLGGGMGRSPDMTSWPITEAHAPPLTKCVGACAPGVPGGILPVHHGVGGAQRPGRGTSPPAARVQGSGVVSRSPREPCPSRGCAPADLREALVGPFERVQVRGVVQVERRIGELHDPPARRGAPRP